MARPVEIIFIRDRNIRVQHKRETSGIREQQGEVDRALSDTFDIHYNTSLYNSFDCNFSCARVLL